MNENISEENDMVSAAERHHQIMEDGNRIVHRLFIGCLGAIVLIAGFIVFFLFKYNPFWKYP